MKKIFKKTLVFVIITAMILTMTSCGMSNTNENKPVGFYDGANYKPTDFYDGSYYNENNTGLDMNNHNTEEYDMLPENNYKSVLDYPISTFSADVDTASYSNIRRFINNGQKVDLGAVRVEEMINYFKYNYPNPKDNEPLSITTELSDCPWNKDAKLMLIGLKTEDIDFSKSPNSNLVFLLDVSGSMQSYDKLPLMQKAFKMLTENLTEKDKVSIVIYASNDRVVIEGISGDNNEIINEALDSLEAGGSTHGSKGIITAYELAERYFIKGGNNRVILATDGDLNVGLTSESELEKLITEKKNSGVFLSVLGFGTENIKDNKMETLADKGNGNYSYIDSLYEAKKVLVDEMGATLVTVAKDVKLQVEFNPANVKGYRLIGYENRLLATEDFNDDKKDAGEMGAGHTVTALYEVVLNDSKMEIPSTKLKYQSNENTNNTDELLTINIRYKKPDSDTSELMSKVLTKNDYKEQLPDNLKFASAVAEFGMILRESKYIGDTNFNNVLDLLDEDIVKDDKLRLELVELVRKAAEIYGVDINIKENLSDSKTTTKNLTSTINHNTSFANFDKTKYSTEEIEVLSAFDKAEKVYAMFSAYGSINTSSSEISLDGGTYYRVDYENINNINGLKNYLSNYFDEKTIIELLNLKADYINRQLDFFVESDGKLYYIDGYAAQGSLSEVKTQFTNIIKNNDNKFTVTVDMVWRGIFDQGPNKYVSYDYIYEKIGDKWIFTNFILPRTYCPVNGVEKPDEFIVSTSPDEKYTFELNKENGFFTLYKKEYSSISFATKLEWLNDNQGTWDPDIMELQDYWWDMEFNKLYILTNPNINPVSNIYCIDLTKEDITYYDTIRCSSENINKNTNYIYFGDMPKFYDVITASEEWYMKKKYGVYIYNLRTNEKFRLNDDNISMRKLNDTSIVFTANSKDEVIDISPYVDKNRTQYVNNIRKAIKKDYNNIEDINIELGQIFCTEQGNYQIVKINNSNDSYFGLYKINNNNYEKIVEKTSSLFLTSNHKYLCIANKNGELKVYDKKFELVINQNAYSDKLLNRYKSSNLDIGEYYIMNSDKNIFLTIKAEDKLVDVININLATKKLSGLPYDIDFHYNNHFIDPSNGYMIYQTGPYVYDYNEYEKRNVLNSEGAQRSLVAINLLNTKQVTIDSDICLYVFYYPQKDSITYNKYIKSEMSSDAEKTYYFDKEFMGE